MACVSKSTEDLSHPQFFGVRHFTGFERANYESRVGFNGHTGELATAFGTRVFMCMYHKKFSVIPLTEHIPFPALVPRKLYEIKAAELALALRQFGAIFKPAGKMAWCGVNPHCGENGRIGNKEEFVVRSIDLLAKQGVSSRRSGFSRCGVYPARALAIFSRSRQLPRQGLIPFKALAGMAGVNTTLGLPRLRVSPDHGCCLRRPPQNSESQVCSRVCGLHLITH